jgi:hypothetical protein
MRNKNKTSEINKRAKLLHNVYLPRFVDTSDNGIHEFVYTLEKKMRVFWVFFFLTTILSRFLSFLFAKVISEERIN